MGSTPAPLGARRCARAWIGFACAAWAAGSSPARVAAHGPAAAITGVVFADIEGPRLLRTTEGLAIESADRWTFLCPARFGLATTSLAVGTTEFAWITGQSGGATWSPSAWSTTGTEGLSAARVIAFARAGSAAYALTYDSDKSEVLALSRAGAQRMFVTAEPWLSIAADGRALWLARFAGNSLEVARLDALGNVLERLLPALRATPRNVQLRAAAGRTFLHVSYDDGAELRELGVVSTTPVSHDRQIFGPVAARDGGLWLAMSDQLVLMGSTDGANARVQLASNATCLEEASDMPYVCLQTAVFRLGDALAGDFVSPAMTLSDLRGPSEDTLAGADDAATCSAQWLTFEADMARAGILPSPVEPGENEPGGEDAATPAAPLDPPRAPDDGDGSASADAGAPPPAADSPPAHELPPSEQASSGCAFAPASSHARGPFAPLWLSALAALHARNRRRAHPNLSRSRVVTS